MARSRFLKSSENRVFTNVREYSAQSSLVETASYAGIAKKTGFLLGLAFIAGVFTYLMFLIVPIVGIILGVAGGIVAFVVIISQIFTKGLIGKQRSIVYAVAEGASLGLISIIVDLSLAGTDSSLQGVSMIAFFTTFFVLAFLLVAYKSGFIKVSQKAKGMLYTIILCTLLLLLPLSIIAIIFNINAIFLLIAVVMIVIASIYLVMSIDDAYQIVNSGAPKESEWTVAFGLLYATLLLYYYILKLLFYLVRMFSKD